MPQLVTVLTEKKIKERLYFAEYRRRNRERILARCKAYHEANREKHKAYYRARYQRIKGDVSKKCKEEKRWLRPEVREQQRIYRQRNASKIRARKREWWKKKFYSDPEFRLLHNMRNRLNGAINRKGKWGRTLELIGCTTAELKAHIQAQFRDGMSWDNYGQWHVDHIKPCDAFDLTKPDQQRACFHYTNLQPMWAMENIKKSAKAA